MLETFAPSIESVSIEFVRRNVPRPEDNVNLSNALARLSNLRTFKISGTVQAATIDQMNRTFDER